MKPMSWRSIYISECASTENILSFNLIKLSDLGQRGWYRIYETYSIDKNVDNALNLLITSTRCVHGFDHFPKVKNRAELKLTHRCLFVTLLVVVVYSSFAGKKTADVKVFTVFLLWYLVSVSIRRTRNETQYFNVRDV